MLPKNSLLFKILSGEVTLDSLSEEELEGALITCDQLIILMEANAYKKGFLDLIPSESLKNFIEGERIAKLMTEEDQTTLSAEDKEKIENFKNTMSDTYGMSESEIKSLVEEAANAKTESTSTGPKEKVSLSDYNLDESFNDVLKDAKERGAFFVNVNSKKLN